MKKFYNIRRRFDMLKCRLASAVKNGLDYVTILISVFLLVSKYQTFFFAIWQKRPKEIKHLQASLANIQLAICSQVQESTLDWSNLWSSQSLFANIRTGWNYLQGTSTLAYFSWVSVTKKTLTTGVNLTKHFCHCLMVKICFCVHLWPDISVLNNYCIINAYGY
jgi:hypothetical protein